MNRIFAALLLTASIAGGCERKQTPATPAGLTPQDIVGIWQFVRTSASACVPDTLTLRLTSATYAVTGKDNIDLTGDWTSNRDARVRVFTGDESTAGVYSIRLTLTESLKGNMDAHDRASGQAYCADGTSAAMTGVRKR